MSERPELFTIGQLARRTGLPVRTIRFWSDNDLIPPTGRSGGGYRLYDAAAVARLDLVRTLRELGLDLATVRAILQGQRQVADVARAHARALDGQIRTLVLRRAVLRSVARRANTTEEMRLMNDLARLSAEQRQRIIDDFVTETFAGADTAGPGAGIAAAMRQLPTDLPADPTDEQVDAWVELAGLVQDPEFRLRARQMAVAAPPADEPPPAYDPAAVMQHAGDAANAGVEPGSASAAAVLRQLVDPELSVGERQRLADRIDQFTDRRVERYWQLMGILNGRPPFPSAVPAFEWFSAALRAQH